MKKKSRILAWFLTAAMMFSMAGGAFAAETTSFADVAQDAPYAQAVEYLYEQKIVTGTGRDSFHPDAVLSRAEFVTLLGRIAGAEVDHSAKSAYSDVVQDKWSTGYFVWAVEKKLLNGYADGRMGQYDTVTQGQVNLILERFCAAYNVNVKGFALATGDATRGSTAVLLAAVAQELKNPVTTRATAYGSVRGYVDPDKAALVWKGIPYATAERWAAPAAPEKWTETLDCTKPGQIAIQSSSGKVSGGEDCLNLDIYAPADAEKLPVVVYIHGGNNQTGQAGEIAGETLVNKADCVYISLNYRLGALGFNCLPALRTGDKLTDSGNYALLDIAKALDWVKENVSAFGGDGNNITLSGFSAGGRDVMAILTSPIFEGKFQKAISFSGGMTIADQADSVKVYAKAFAPLAVEDGKKATEEEAYAWLQTADKDVKTWLEGLSGERISKLMGDAGIRMAVFPHLFNDGYVIPKDGFDTKNYADVPLMMITGTNEFSLFSMGGAFSGTPFQSPEWFKEFNWAVGYGSKLYELANAEESAVKLHSKGYGADMYTLAIDYGNGQAKEGMMGAVGAFHGIFVPMVDNYSQNYTGLVGGAFRQPAAEELSDALCAYIGSFIRSGNPNGTDAGTQWTAWSDKGNNTLLFGSATDKGDISMVERRIDYDKVIADIEGDNALSAERKAFILSNILNGRWFSGKLDDHFKNPSLWVK